MKRFFLLIVLAIFSNIAINIYAQESINTSGGEAIGDGGTVSYSVGQVTYQTHTGTNGSVAQGVQQAFEISVVSAIEDAKNINLSVSAYPNPTTDFLQLGVDSSTPLSNQSMSYQLFDMNGKLLQTKKLIDTVTLIDMSHYLPATYFVKVINGNAEVKSFKIIKN